MSTMRATRSVGAVLVAIGAALILLAGTTGRSAALTVTAPAGAVHLHEPTLTDHDCDATEWHFVINKISGDAPATITVEWSNGTTSTLPMTHETMTTAHYSSTEHLDDGVVPVDAWFMPVEGSTYGMFNLSHGPCL